MKSRSPARNLLPAAWSFPSRPAARRQTCPWNWCRAATTAQAQYRGEYPGLNQSARYQVYLGDAWTDPLALSVTPLPVVEIEAEVVPPVYARQSADEVQKLPRGMRQFPVLAGSEVRLRLDSDRPLKAAEVRSAEQSTMPPTATSRDARGQRRRKSGRCPPPARRWNPWPRNCRTRFRFTTRKAKPWTSRSKGTITIEPDQPPGITARTKTPIVVPTGSPNIHYEAADDHALGCIWLTWEATSGDQPTYVGVRPTIGTGVRA